MPDLLPDHEWWLLVIASAVYVVLGWVAVYRRVGIVAQPVGVPQQTRYVSTQEYWHDQLGLDVSEELFRSRFVFSVGAIALPPALFLFYLDGDTWHWMALVAFLGGLAVVMTLLLYLAAMGSGMNRPKGSVKSRAQAGKDIRGYQMSTFLTLAISASLVAGGVAIAGIWV